MVTSNILEAVATGKVASLTAAELRADIWEALSLYSESSKEETPVYVTASDSNGSTPTAWIISKYLDGSDIKRMAAHGWKLELAWSEKRKVKAMFSVDDRVTT